MKQKSDPPPAACLPADVWLQQLRLESFCVRLTKVTILLCLQGRSLNTHEKKKNLSEIRLSTCQDLLAGRFILGSNNLEQSFSLYDLITSLWGEFGSIFSLKLFQFMVIHFHKVFLKTAKNYPKIKITFQNFDLFCWFFSSATLIEF